MNECVICNMYSQATKRAIHPQSELLEEIWEGAWQQIEEDPNENPWPGATSLLSLLISTSSAPVSWEPGPGWYSQMNFRQRLNIFKPDQSRRGRGTRRQMMDTQKMESPGEEGRRSQTLNSDNTKTIFAIMWSYNEVTHWLLEETERHQGHTAHWWQGQFGFQEGTKVVLPGILCLA